MVGALPKGGSAVVGGVGRRKGCVGRSGAPTSTGTLRAAGALALLSAPAPAPAPAAAAAAAAAARSARTAWLMRLGTPTRYVGRPPLLGSTLACWPGDRRAVSSGGGGGGLWPPPLPGDRRALSGGGGKGLLPPPRPPLPYCAPGSGGTGMLRCTCCCVCSANCCVTRRLREASSRRSSRAHTKGSR